MTQAPSVGGISGSTSAPKYERAKAYVLDLLHEGAIRPDQPLPREVDLAAELKVSRNTIRQALAELEEEGVIRRVRGEGTFLREDWAKAQQDAGSQVYALVYSGLYFSSLHRGFSMHAMELGYQMIGCDTYNDVHKQGNLIMQLMDKRVDGVALLPTSMGPPPTHQVRVLQRMGIPVVLLHRAVRGVAAPLIELPAHAIGEQAGRAIIDAGHERVGIVSGHQSDIAGEYGRGVSEVVQANGGQIADAHRLSAGQRIMTVDEQDRQVQTLAQRLRPMLESKDRPTVLFTTFVSIAEMVYLIATDMGLSVPGDLSIVTVSPEETESPLARRITAVTLDEAAAAKHAIRLLDEMSTQRRTIDADERVTLPTGMRKGMTLGGP